MAVTILDKRVSRVLILDDEPTARDGYEYLIEDLDLEPVKVAGPVDTVKSFIAGVQPTDAVVCDYHLKKHKYAFCDGDVLVAECFKKGIPGILCTTFTDVDVTIRRDCLRYISALVKTNSPEPGQFVEAWRNCISEMNGAFGPKRRPWRTLVRVAEVDADGRYFYVVVPAWNPRQKVRLYYDSVSEGIQETLEPDMRFHALVNIGAASDEELFFDRWESE